MNTFGNRLKSLRENHKLTQEQLANALEISKSSIGMYELDKRQPDFETMEAIADFFNVDMDYLYGRTNCPNAYQSQLIASATNSENAKTLSSENMGIGEKLKQARIDAGFKVEEVSDILEKEGYQRVSAKTIYSWESDNSQPAPDCFLRLCDLYKIHDILAAFGYKEENESTTESDELEKAEQIFNELPEDLQQDALRYMRYLAEQEAKQE